MATQEQIKAFFAKWSSAAREASQMTGVPASVILAQSALESAYGTSTLAKDANNLFGVKAGSSWEGPTLSLYDAMEKSWSDYRVYSSPLDGLTDWIDNVIGGDRYDKARTSNPFVSIQEIKNAGYATDPDYVSKVSSIITGNYLTLYDDPGLGSPDLAPTITLQKNYRDRWDWSRPDAIPADIFAELRDVIFGEQESDYTAAIEAAEKAGYTANADGEITIPITADFIAGNTFLQDLALTKMLGYNPSEVNPAAPEGKLTTTGHLTNILFIIGILVVMVVAVFRMFPAAGGVLKGAVGKTVAGGA